MTVRVGVIGVGVMGADHARKLARVISGSDLVAVTDFNSEVAGAVATELGARVQPDGQALIADADVDAVVIATRDDTHADLVRAALRAGKPVMCEKPLAPTAAECRELVAAQRELAPPVDLVTVGFMRRFDPPYVALRERVRDGALGAPMMVHGISRNVSSAPGGDSAASITNSAIHELDIMPWLLDSPIVEVSYQHGRSSEHSGARQDPQFYLLRTASGVLVTVELFLNARYGYETRCEVVMETGTAALALPAHIVTDAESRRAVDYPVDWIPRYSDAYRIELQEWVDSVVAGRPSALATAEDGLRAALVADALIESMKSGGRWVEVAD
ncbi:inositol 2-dehydrogenase [Mycolicibacterium cosmeticum]|uniref:Inositol 2-dehydrogenase n=1 Tax=Mycolicibacterium cosmeticum TaxID=258533 RepID=W9AJR6_MYCCO|nr:Gfo/Idh/MocA family oxidoreductase [Mycolicibacterium cosmeticum]TLH66941.1 inositol 2-dehydrogenase [Mycolicibacterium cosmeticum]CDO05964.1 inositol 2-dehydrogenase [Mycolicibacterium cosmeticum]